MSKTLSNLLVVVVLFVGITFGVASAADQMINMPIQDVTSAIDKNGNPYTRVIVTKTAKLSGVEYETGVPVMFFGPMASLAENLQSGDNLKAIVNVRQYKGNDSYTAIKLLK